MYKYGIRYGMICGILSGSMMVIAFYSGIPTKGNSFITIANTLFLYAPSFLAIYSVNKFNGEQLEFKKALRLGISSSLLYTFIFSAFTAVYYYFLNPNFGDKYLVDIEISLKQSGISAAELQRQMEEWKADMSAFNQTSKTLIAMSIAGAVFAAINSLILCKKD